MLDTRSAVAYETTASTNRVLSNPDTVAFIRPVICSIFVTFRSVYCFVYPERMARGRGRYPPVVTASPVRESP